MRVRMRRMLWRTHIFHETCRAFGHTNKLDFLLFLFVEIEYMYVYVACVTVNPLLAVRPIDFYQQHVFSSIRVL